MAFMAWARCWQAHSLTNFEKYFRWINNGQDIREEWVVFSLQDAPLLGNPDSVSGCDCVTRCWFIHRVRAGTADTGDNARHDNLLPTVCSPKFSEWAGHCIKPQSNETRTTGVDCYVTRAEGGEPGHQIYPVSVIWALTSHASISVTRQLSAVAWGLFLVCTHSKGL